MSDSSKKEDELAGSEQPFVQHLIELRDRLVKATLAIVVVAIVRLLRCTIRLKPGTKRCFQFIVRAHFHGTAVGQCNRYRENEFITTISTQTAALLNAVQGLVNRFINGGRCGIIRFVAGDNECCHGH